ncbi:tyrosine-type recombinase/integrase [Gloeobacter violaceus]|uniref:Integrase/recombinase n=1 Tax=Gloeobacter violaceus (strain ATCC 29082 / PCC 7421) TaxID=251221 RepID=Q7NNG2_GLOVI|nr:site-specific integrase [Gloeobacter violaceus]BAC88390.1 integrase/recombinase [Gloeobacter violaceus PCC 7421]
MSCLDDFWDYLERERRLQPATCRAYRCDLKQWFGYLQTANPLAARPEQLRSYLVQLGERGIGHGTLRRKRSSLRVFYGYLHRQGVIAADPAAALPTETSRVPGPPPLRPQQLEALLGAVGDDACGVCHRALILALYAGGLRSAEVSAANLENLDWERGLWRLPQRDVLLDPRLYAALLDYLRCGRPGLAAGIAERALFVSRRGHRLSVRALQAYLSRYGVTAQQLRNSYAAHLLEGGTDPVDVQALLGLRSTQAAAGRQPTVAQGLRRVYDLAHPRSGLHKK